MGDMTGLYKKVISWLSAPCVQQSTQADEFPFVTRHIEVRSWSINDVLKGSLPWTRGTDDAAAWVGSAQRVTLKSLAQRLAVAVQVCIDPPQTCSFELCKMFYVCYAII